MDESTSFNPSAILRTKLYAPPITPNLVPRVALLERLQQNRQRPLTLISAPAGYGKSILASMWLQASGLPGGWVSLDESDNNLHTFATYLLAAIETAVPQSTLQTKALISSSSIPSPANLAHYLLADLDQFEIPFLLVLDDMHTIREEKIFTFLEALLNHPSPVLHLVLVGRQDPPLAIASWRAYNRLNEIRMRDLRFSSPETAEFLKKFLGREIDESVADEWTKHTEGWATALHTAAISLVDHAITTHPGRELQGGSYYLQEYLLAEVLSRLASYNRARLLKVSLLDRFCAPLCDAVCQDQDAGSQPKTMTGQTFIRWLGDANLFLIKLDERGEWFRFHHLFQAYLQQALEHQLSGQEIAALHLQASRWFAENGWVGEAIEHALAANEPITALAVFADNRNAALNGERWHQLEQWVRLFPEDVVENNPLLLLTRAHLPLAYGFDYDLEPLLTQAGSLLANLPADSPELQKLWAEVTYFSGLGALMMGPAATAIDAGAKMKELLPADAYYLRGQALALEAFGHQMSGNIKQSDQMFHEALDADNWPANLQIKAYFNLTILYFMDADLATAQIFAEKGIELASKHKLDASEARCFGGTTYYLQNDLTQAESRLLPVTLHTAWIDPVILAHAACTLMHLYYAQGKAEKARAIAQQARSQLEEQDNVFSLQLFDMFQGELALEQGDAAYARQLIIPLSVSLQLPIWFWHYYIPQLTPIKLWLAEGEKVDRALALLTEMDEFLRKLNRNIHRIDILALQALAYKSLHNWPKALEKLAQSVELAAQGKLIRNYLDLGPQMRELLAQLYRQKGLDDRIDWPYIAEILDAFSLANAEDDRSASTPSNSVDPLTGREREVLKYLATDLSTKEIAETMSVTWSTTRTHIKNIYSKLGVHGRYEAVQYAEEHKLL